MATTAMSAQSLEQTLSPKELKAKQKAELAEFKAKQKADLAAFIEKQKNSVTGKTTDESVFTMPELTNEADSAAFFYGSYNAKGLKDYIVRQMGLDTTYINDFYRGVLDRANIDNSTPETQAYNAGTTIGGQMESMAHEISRDYYAADPGNSLSTYIIAKSVLAALNGKNPIKPEDGQKEFNKIMNKRVKENTERLYGGNRKKGDQFLIDNHGKPGVVTLADGLQYKILKEGNGPIPKATDKVKVNYEGHLLDGTEFDSSYKRKEASTFRVNQVIKGWSEALTIMPVGSKWEIYVPYQLGYGERGNGKIEPYSALIFTVELLGIE